jgi:hypothetical protein
MFFLLWIVTNITSARWTMHCCKTRIPCGDELVVCGLYLDRDTNPGVPHTRRAILNGDAYIWTDLRTRVFHIQGLLYSTATLGCRPFFPPLKVGWVRPKRGCLLALAYYAFPRWYEFGEWRWNDTLTGENWITRRKTCPNAILSTTNPTWIDPGLRGERPVTNDLSHGTALADYHFLTASVTGCPWQWTANDEQTWTVDTSESCQR